MTDSAPQRAGSTAGERAGVLVPIVLSMKTEEPTLLRGVEGTKGTKRTEGTEEEEGTRGGRRVGESEGEEATLVAVFESEEGALLAFAVGLVRRRSVAEELVQDAFLRLHEVWGQVENPRGWLYRSVRNLALNHLRDHRRETALEEAPEPVGRGAGQMRSWGGWRRSAWCGCCWRGWPRRTGS